MKDNSTIAITLRFWSAGIGLRIKGKNKIACRDSGSAIIEANATKMIKADSKPFACYEDIIPVIKELLRENRIFVVSNNRTPRILSSRRKLKI